MWERGFSKQAVTVRSLRPACCHPFRPQQLHGLLNAIEVDPSVNGKTASDLCNALKDAGLLAKPTQDHTIRLAVRMQLTSSLACTTDDLTPKLMPPLLL